MGSDEFLSLVRHGLKVRVVLNIVLTSTSFMRFFHPFTQPLDRVNTGCQLSHPSSGSVFFYLIEILFGDVTISQKHVAKSFTSVYTRRVLYEEGLTLLFTATIVLFFFLYLHFALYFLIFLTELNKLIYYLNQNSLYNLMVSLKFS